MPGVSKDRKWSKVDQPCPSVLHSREYGYGMALGKGVLRAGVGYRGEDVGLGRQWVPCALSRLELAVLEIMG